MHVVKLAQPGYDVKTCGDENLIYSSLWPLLKIYKQGPFTIGDLSKTTTVINHDLQYPAFFWAFSNQTIDTYLDSGVQHSEQRSEYGFGLNVDTGKLSYTGIPFSTASGQLKLYYYLFALDLTKQFTAPIINVGAVSGGGGSHVFKIAKDTKDVSSTNLEDFILHSQARSPLIHSVNPGVVGEDIGGPKAFTVYHKLGYIPMFFGFTKNTDGSYSTLGTGVGGSTIFEADEQKVQFQEAVAGRQMTIVILKDPFIVDYTVGVTV